MTLSFAIRGAGVVPASTIKARSHAGGSLATTARISPVNTRGFNRPATSPTLGAEVVPRPVSRRVVFLTHRVPGSIHNLFKPRTRML